ncbi:sugar ABC transporter substrate-binding protein [Dictyobacter sp. S3.2.2.5]|uniref:Sugar ABC transporter substrate-binding protein n=1 Tax=Dictyobacter halimunensis TaxID=3026934 RepID=A0ABQ6FQ40_9CHLR|nr:sugar ABC transporter substrate-binding protein [Dictyobacter sp. S3.2.2.5]
MMSVKVSGAPKVNPRSASYQSWLEVVTRFEKAHPQYNIVGDSYQFDPTTFYPMFAAGQADDAINTYFTESQYMIEHHIAADIQADFDTTPFKDIFSPDVRQVVSGPNGHMYGLPANAYVLGLIYNRALFTKAGLDPSKPPTNWDDFRAYARRIAEKTGVSGFVENAAGNQGGWHFINWLYSTGGVVELYAGTQATAAFHSAQGVAVLRMLQQMRFTDKSMQMQTATFQQGDITNAVATGKAGMCIGAGDSWGSLYSGKGSLDFLGLGPMPQNNGQHGALGGGGLWVINSKSTANAIRGAVLYTSYRSFDLHSYEDQLKAQVAQNKPVGIPGANLFTGSYARQYDAITRKYANLPLQNYAAYAQSSVPLVPEPRLHAQDLYSELDAVMQAIFTDPNADPENLLKNTASSFQSRYLTTAS